jgi:hypothetical protein
MIKVDESTWSLENQKLVLIHLEKVDQYKWWDHLSK